MWKWGNLKFKQTLLGRPSLEQDFCPTSQLSFLYSNSLYLIAFLAFSTPYLKPTSLVLAFPQARMKISIITNILVLPFYEYIGYIGDISDILEIYRRIFWHRISVNLKLIRNYKNVRKTLKNKIKSIIEL